MIGLGNNTIIIAKSHASQTTRTYHEPKHVHIQEHHPRPVGLKYNIKIIANHMHYKLHVHIRTRKVLSHLASQTRDSLQIICITNHARTCKKSTVSIASQTNGLTNNKRIVENHTDHKPHTRMQEKHRRPNGLTNNKRIIEIARITSHTCTYKKRIASQTTRESLKITRITNHTRTYNKSTVTGHTNNDRIIAKTLSRLQQEKSDDALHQKTQARVSKMSLQRAACNLGPF